jgi:hypothetical protein
MASRSSERHIRENGITPICLRVMHRGRCRRVDGQGLSRHRGAATPILAEAKTRRSSSAGEESALRDLLVTLADDGDGSVTWPLPGVHQQSGMLHRDRTTKKYATISTFA